MDATKGLGAVAELHKFVHVAIFTGCHAQALLEQVMHALIEQDVVLFHQQVALNAGQKKSCNATMGGTYITRPAISSGTRATDVTKRASARAFLGRCAAEVFRSLSSTITAEFSMSTTPGRIVFGTGVVAGAGAGVGFAIGSMLGSAGGADGSEGETLVGSCNNSANVAFTAAVSLSLFFR